MSTMKAAFRAKAEVWGSPLGPSTTIEARDEEVHAFVKDLASSELLECLQEIASWPEDEAHEDLRYAADALYTFLSREGRGSELAQAAVQVMTEQGPAEILYAWAEGGDASLTEEVLRKVDWRNGSAELQMALAGALGRLGGAGARATLEDMRASIDEQEVLEELAIAFDNLPTEPAA